MYAVFQTGGKQFRAEEGFRIRVPSLDAEPGDAVTFEHVLLAGTEDSVAVGTPTVEGASVTAAVLRHGREKKIIVFKRKRRKGHRKKAGHRQKYTEIEISSITAP